MSERNRRSHYHQPTLAEVAEIKRDPCNVQWQDVWRVASRAARKNLSAWEVHEMLDLKPTDHVQLHGKDVWGWWRIIPEAMPPFEEMVPVCEQCDVVMGHQPTGWTCPKCGSHVRKTSAA